ncbi:hypothetical protein GCM10027022_06980 [Alpinimonas psychrophila]|uniref:PH domain-containing protein n=1 Tax=Alpinimonas psychrophila TaxID=748908 RepID=A0A7W3JSN5_9MICO|nr:hypothetical protein [Alpinimonas psychrophila]MBA8828518.1 hypothetical protein [Alpinimonas psychrophila]
MDRYSIGAIIVGALVALAWWGMYRSWKRRSATSATMTTTTTRTGQSLAGTAITGSPMPGSPLPGNGDTLEFRVLYVATTPTEEPLTRLNLPGLGFRAKATVRVLHDLIEIAPAGEYPTTIGAASFLGVRSARVTIDRVVENDGLTAVDWVATNSTSGERSLVTSYFRIPNTRLRASLEATLEAFGAAHTTTVKEVAS